MFARRLEHEHFDFSRPVVAVVEHDEMAGAASHPGAAAQSAVSHLTVSRRRGFDLVGDSGPEIAWQYNLKITTDSLNS